MPSTAEPVLILFDVDLTLISTGGAGRRALLNAGRRLHGPAFHDQRVDYAGRLDQLIIADLLRVNGLPPTPDAAAAIAGTYRDLLARELTNGDAATLPGVRDLLAALAQRSDAVLGVLTGNFEPTGRAKLHACGLDPDAFSVRVWADDAHAHDPRRDQLPAVGRQRCHEVHGFHPPAHRTIIVGDTPHDVACAHANGCPCLAVATGHYSFAQLQDAGADHIVHDLTDTATLLAWLTSPKAP